MTTQPITSRLAHEGVKERNQKVRHADMIMQSLLVRKQGNYEEIAMFCNLTPMQVVRRLSELVDAGKIEWTGKTSKTFSGDTGKVYRIKTAETPISSQRELF